MVTRSHTLAFTPFMSLLVTPLVVHSASLHAWGPHGQFGVRHLSHKHGVIAQCHSSVFMYVILTVSHPQCHTLSLGITQSVSQSIHSVSQLVTHPRSHTVLDKWCHTRGITQCHTLSVTLGDSPTLHTVSHDWSHTWYHTTAQDQYHTVEYLLLLSQCLRVTLSVTLSITLGPISFPCPHPTGCSHQNCRSMSRLFPVVLRVLSHCLFLQGFPVVRAPVRPGPARDTQSKRPRAHWPAGTLGSPMCLGLCCVTERR